MMLNTPDNIKWQEQETIARISDRLKYADRDSSDLPPELGRIIELLCSAGMNLLEARRLALRGPRNKQDPDGHASSIKFSVERATEKIQEALRQAEDWKAASAINATMKT
jgi:hypothetical protein